jgi:hypothetical protein
MKLLIIQFSYKINSSQAVKRIMKNFTLVNKIGVHPCYIYI